MKRFLEWVRGWVQRAFMNPTAWCVWHRARGLHHINRADYWLKIEKRQSRERMREIEAKLRRKARGRG